MEGAYQPTTEHRESQESLAGTTCTPMRWSGRKKRSRDLPQVEVTDESSAAQSTNPR